VGLRVEAEQVDCVARGFFADVCAFRGGEAGEGVGDVDAADVGWGALLGFVKIELMG